MKKITAFGMALGIAASVAGVWGACKSPAAVGGIMLTGTWGSSEGHLTATEVNTVFTGACGSGNTSAPIMLDKHGRFDLTGVYGASGTAQSSARFVGATGDHTLTLRVLATDSTPMLGPIVMNLDQQPTLGSCTR
jgi:hypothetical protein